MKDNAVSQDLNKEFIKERLKAFGWQIEDFGMKVKGKKDWLKNRLYKPDYPITKDEMSKIAFLLDCTVEELTAIRKDDISAEKGKESYIIVNALNTIIEKLDLICDGLGIVKEEVSNDQ